MRAIPQLGIVLGDETTAHGSAFVGSSGLSLPIGHVEIGLEGLGHLALHSYSPEALVAVATAFYDAYYQLVDAIAERTEKSARTGQAPGTDALGEAASATAVEGERLDDSVATGAAHPRTGCDPVAVRPSNLNEDVVEATVYCWADESQVCICRNGNDCPRRPPVRFIEHGSKFDRSMSELDAGL